jgi:hypothetical protein
MVAILVAVDGSQQGTDALLWVAKHIWKPDMQLDVVTGASETACCWALEAVDLSAVHSEMALHVRQVNAGPKSYLICLLSYQ